MKMFARVLSVIIVAIFIGSIMTSLTTGLNQKEQQELDDLEVVSEAPPLVKTYFYLALIPI